TITFQADGLPYSGYSENQEFTLTQRVRVPKPPQLAVASTLTNVSKTTVEYLPLGSSLTFPYTVSYTYEGEAYPLVNEGWTTSNAAVADVMKTESGWWLFAQTEGEAVLTFHAEGGAYGFESFEWERRVNVVSILPPAPPEEETPPTPPIEEEPPVVPPTPPEEETPTPPTPPTPPEEETPPTPPVPPVEEEPPVLPPAPSGVITIHWTDGDADKVLKVGEQFRLRLLLTMDGETYTFPNGGAEWLSSNEGVVAVNWGELQALKPGFATIYAHVAIGERAAVVSRYITVPKDGDLYGRAGVEEVVSGGGEATYYSLRGQYIGKTLPAEAGVYVRREGGKTEKVLVRRRR
ncbi:MAG: hypothetical protein LBT73_03690, partial [Tannerellaceae bacterium]|nr:hypothetical protein [Tannerellaceae bacterium]